MPGKRRILVVDDHFEMLEFLRSMLEMSNSGYQVLAAPSAEEGLLELRRTVSQQPNSSGERPIDLLITDVRLPGMSGFDLVRKVRAFRPNMPIMMITAYVSAQGREEANSLGVYRYFEKPLDTDALLAAVHAALSPNSASEAPQLDPGETFAVGPSPNGPAPVPAPREDVIKRVTAKQAPVDDQIMVRLETLLSDTGAVQTLLADKEGVILFRAGEAPGVALERLAQLLARNLSDSFALADELKSTEPFTIQYQAGERADLYSANIGRDHFLALLFDARARRGRIGTVWVFAQRAIKGLRDLLTLRDAPKEERSAASDTAKAAKQATPPELSKTGGEVTEKSSEDKRAEPEEGPATPAVAAGKGSGAAEAGSGEETALFELMDEADAPPETDLDAFWEEATAGAGNVNGSGLSFEEAVKRGLLPPELQEAIDRS